MLIAIDHGNKNTNTNTNTVHHIFTSGLTESDTRSPFGDTVLQIGEKDFALRLARLFEKKSVSAREMSLAIGQNAGYVNNIEAGKSLPSLPGVFYICEYLQISPRELLDLEFTNPCL